MIIELEDGRVQVDTSGSGPELVLLHSLLTDSGAWDLVLPALERGHTVHRISLPGFGASTPLNGANITISDIADRVVTAMDAIACSRDAALLGNGLGAFVAVALAVHHGDRLGPLIVANGGSGFSEQRSVAFDTMSRLVTEGGMEAVVDVAVSRIFPQDYLDEHRYLVAERREVLMKIDPGAFAAACRALGALDLSPHLGSITNPTLVIAGTDDGATPPDMAEGLAGGIAGARLVVFDRCGHCPPLQRPDEFSELVTSYLAEVG